MGDYITGKPTEAWVTQESCYPWGSWEDFQAAPLTEEDTPLPIVTRLSGEGLYKSCKFQKLPETFELCSFSESGKIPLLLEFYMVLPPCRREHFSSEK